MDNATVEKKKNPLKALLESDRLKSIKAQYGYLALAFSIPAIIMLLIYFAMGHKPIADGSVLVLDLNAQYVYFYEALRDFVWGDGSLLYSFSRSLGGEYMGIYAYYTASPLSYIVALFPKDGLLYALLLIIAIKIGLCGLSFGYYLHKKSKEINKLTIVLFSTMFALCAYNIVYQNNIMWLDSVYLLPILTYSIERLIKRGRFKMFVITLALVMMTHYYIGYMLCWYVFFCFFFTYFSEGNKAEINQLGEKAHFVKSLLRIALFSALAIGIAFFMIGTAYYSLQFGKNTFSEPNWDFFAKFDFIDFLPKLLPGSYDTVMHEGLPNIYCGVLALFALPIYYMAKKVTSREKIFYTALVAIYLLISVINPADLIMHGFQEPNCLNYRYSFIITFLILYMAYKGFCEIKGQSPKVILGISAFLILIVVILQRLEFANFMLKDNEYFEYGYVLHKLPFLQVIVFSLAMIFIISAILCYLIKTQREKLVSLVLLSAVCLELFGNGIILLASLGCNVGFSSYSSYNGFFDDLYPFTTEVLEADDTFYRSEKTFHRTTNDNMALGLKGLSNSTSTLNAKVISMLDYLGYSADAHWTKYLGGNPLGDSLFGIKYIISRKDDLYGGEPLFNNEVMDKYYIQTNESDFYLSYQNPYALSIAYGVNEAVKDFNFYDTAYDYTVDDGYRTPFEVYNALLNAMADKDFEYFTEIPFDTKENIDFENVEGSRLISVDGSTEYQVKFGKTVEKPSFIHFQITAQKTGPVYFYLPSKYERNTGVKVNDIYCTTLNEGNRIACLGYFEAGEQIKISLEIKDEFICFAQNTPLFYTLDMELLEKAANTLKEENLITDEGCSDTNITGTLTTKEDGKMILTTIPYDAGWIVKIDGNEVETYPAMNDTFIAFDIENAGEHTIEFTYRPKIYVLSGIVSIVSLAIFVTFSLFESKKRRKNKGV